MYLSLGSTNIITNNTEILITDIGDDNDNGHPPLICHTDLVGCCRRSETMLTEGIGDWYYPNGALIPGGSGSSSDSLSFVRWRNNQMIRLARREDFTTPPLGPTGSYCCTVKTNEGEMIFCANLGK